MSQLLDTLLAEEKVVKDQLAEIGKRIYRERRNPDNWKFTDKEDAEYKVEDFLQDEAYDDCEGSYRCGNPEYSQHFSVNGVMYKGILECDYNRHDKKYYYLDSSEFRVELVD